MDVPKPTHAVQKQNTGFIPGKRGVRRRRRGGVFYILSILVFFIAFIALGGAVGYEYWLSGKIDRLNAELENASIDLEKIDEFRELATRVRAANTLIERHIALAPAVAFIENNTLTNTVRFNGFALDNAGNVAAPEYTLQGTAESLESLAFQLETLKGAGFMFSSDITELSFERNTGDIGFVISGTLGESETSFERAAAGGEEGSESADADANESTQ